MMKYGAAIEAMMAGEGARRAEWPPEYGEKVIYKESEEHSGALFFMVLTNGDERPWSPSHRDIVADDWEAVGAARKRTAK